MFFVGENLYQTALPVENPQLKDMPQSQQELIDILNEVKAGNYSQGDADMLFKEWEIRHKRASQTVSFKYKQVNLVMLIVCRGQHVMGHNSSILSQTRQLNLVML